VFVVKGSPYTGLIVTFDTLAVSAFMSSGSPVNSRTCLRNISARAVRGVDLGGGLGALGSDVEVRERPGWRTSEPAMWEEAAALDPGSGPALKSIHDEDVRVLGSFELMRRVVGHNDIDRAYGSLATYVTAHALAVEGPIRGYYIVGSHETLAEANGAPRSTGPSST
jgi:hypothetical protein